MNACSKCALAGSLFFLLSTLPVTLPDTVTARPTTMGQLSSINNKLTKTSVGYGAIEALYRPRYDRVMDANLTMEDDDIVFVADLPDGPRIYPQRIMVWHQVVNELINGESVAITYSPTSGTLAVYDTHMGGFNLMLDVEGSLFDGNSILIDRNTGSLWLQELGMAFDGSLMGRGLPLLPCYWTTWGAAKRMYPNVPVLGVPPGRRPYGRDPYGEYRNPDSYYHNDDLAYPVQRQDRRFPPKTSMFCLEINEVGLVAIDVNYVRRNGAVNFFIGPRALLAVHDPALDVIRVFDRQIWSKPFLFRKEAGGHLIDLTTKTVWDCATGVALSGPLQGASMPQLYGIYSMWFAWASLNPETNFIPGPGEVSGHLLQTGEPRNVQPPLGFGGPVTPVPGPSPRRGLPAAQPGGPKAIPPLAPQTTPQAGGETAPQQNGPTFAPAPTPEQSGLYETYPGMETGGLPVPEYDVPDPANPPLPRFAPTTAGSRASTGASRSTPGAESSFRGGGTTSRENR